MELVVAILLTMFGAVSVVKPRWIAAIDRRQKAAGTTRHPEDIEFSDGHYGFIQIVGFFIGAFGLIVTLRLL